MPYYYRKPEPGEVFGSVITFLVIAAIIAAFAFYFGIIVLFVFLGIGAAIGLVYAIIVYAKSFAAARSPSGGSCSKPLRSARSKKVFRSRTARSFARAGTERSRSRNGCGLSSRRPFSFSAWL